MICPICKKGETSVVDSRPTEDGTAIRRRRLCICGQRFTTFERVQFRELTVVKKNGRKSTFDREKLSKSIYVALKKRPIDTETAENETPDTGASESETLNSEVETEQLDDKTLDEYDDGAVFKDNAIGISGVGVQEYILPVNDISVPQVIETESKKNNTVPNRQSAKKVSVSDDVKPFQDVSEESKNDERILSEIIHQTVERGSCLYKCKSPQQAESWCAYLT